MNCVLQDKRMPVFGDGLQTRAFSYVADVAPVIARAPRVEAAANQIFNAGADKPHTVLEVAQAVAAAFGVKCEVEHLPARNEVIHAFSSHEKLHRVFAPPPPVELVEGIDRMAAWVRDHGPMRPVEFGGEIEIPRNLPPSWRRTEPARNT